MGKPENIRIPVNDIEVFNLEESDDRFQKVKIWIAHTGENLNGTSFSKKTLQGMIPSLTYTPILGYIEKNSSDDDDFSDHRSRIILKDGDIEYEYLGHSYGFIPDEHNAQFEFRGGKEWLTAEGYLWTKFSKGIEIISDNSGKKSQSMEINIIDGFVDDDSVFNVTNARFTGLCILGDDVAPAMSGSTIEFFNADIFKEEIRSMMYEFSQKGAKQSLDNELEQTVEPEVTDPVVEDTSVEPETVEPEVTEDNAEFTEDGDVTVEEPGTDEPVEDTEATVEAPEDDEKPETYEVTYSFSYEDIRAKLYRAVSDKYKHDGDYSWPYVIETHGDRFVYGVYNYQDETDEFYSVDYSLNDSDEVVLGDKSEVLSMFVSADEKKAIEDNRSYVKELQEELKALTEFKEQVDKTEKQLVLDSYKEQLSEEAYSALNETAEDMTVESLEKEIVFAIYKEQSKEVQAEKSTARVSAYSYTNTTGRYGDLDRFFKK